MRRNRLPTPVFLGFPCGSAGKESVYNAGELGSIPGLGRAPGEGNGYPFQYPGLELHHLEGFPGASDDKKSARNAGDPGSIPGSERSPGEGNGNPLQYTRLENPMDKGVWRASVHGVTECQTQLSN